MAILSQLLSLYSAIIIVRALISWVSPDPRNPIVRLLSQVTEPVLAPLRRLVPPRVFGGLDLSPILAIVLITLLRSVLLSAF